MIADFLLALGMILSLATELRPAGGVVGPGEICIALWLVWTALRYVPSIAHLRITPAARNIAIFWLLLTAALCIGTLTAFATGIYDDPAKAWHDVQAYVLVASVSLLCALDPNAAIRFDRVAWSLAVIGTVLLALQLAAGYGLMAFPGIDPWYYDRLRGFSSNPNQLAFACVVLVFVALHLAETTRGLTWRILAFLLAILPFVTGFLTKSDSFHVVVAIGIPGLLVLKARNSIQSGATKFGIGRTTSLFALAALPIVLVTAVPAFHVVTGLSPAIERQFIKSNKTALNKDAPDRFHLWGMAISKGLKANMLGLGPGEHLERRRRTNVDADKEEPVAFEHFSADPKPNFETHNTILDLFTQGGLLAVFAFIWLTASSVLRAVRAGLGVLPMLLCSLLWFGLFHVVIRHPILWFVIAWCLATTLYAQKRSAVAYS